MISLIQEKVKGRGTGPKSASTFEIAGNLHLIEPGTEQDCQLIHTALSIHIVGNGTRMWEYAPMSVCKAELSSSVQCGRVLLTDGCNDGTEESVWDKLQAGSSPNHSEGVSTPPWTLIYENKTSKASETPHHLE